MTATINASTSSGIVQTADTSGELALQSNGTTKLTISSTGAYGQLVSGTAVASTSGTSIDFTGIPSWVKRITVMLRGVSSNGVSYHLFQLGSGSIQTSGYTVNSTQDSVSLYYDGGFHVINNAAGDVCDGVITFTKLSGNIWVGVGFQGRVGGGVGTRNTVGSVELSGTLDRVRFTTINGTDTFDAGSINIMYEG